MERVVQQLQARGFSAALYDPAAWAGVAEALATNQRPEGPVILVGYSMGAGASTDTAARLASAGIPVRAIVIVEAWNPTPLSANVGRAIHYFATGAATMLAPGPGFTGSIENIDLKPLVPGVDREGHVSMSHMQAVQDLVVGRIVSVAKPDTRRSRR